MKFFIGLILGIAIAGGVAFYLNKAQNPFIEKGVSTATPGTESSDHLTTLLLAPGNKMQTLPADIPTQATRKPTTSSPSYDFYEVLQGEKEITPQNNPSASTQIKAAYLIQVGAYTQQNLDNDMKARLALLGFVATIQAQENNGKIINKVILGPYQNETDAVGTLQQLAQDNIKATLIHGTIE